MTDMSTNLHDAAKPKPGEDAASNEELTAEEIWEELEDEDSSNPDEAPSRSELTRDDDDAGAPAGGKGKQDDADFSEDEPGGPPLGDGSQSDTTPAEPTDAQPAENDEVNRLREKNKRLLGQVSGQGRKIQNLIAERDRLKEVSNSITQEGDTEARRQALEAAQEEYGDIIGPVAETMTALERQVETLTSGNTHRVDQIDQEIRDLQTAEYGVLLDVHPDFREVFTQNRDVLNEWIEDQPKYLRDAFEANKNGWVDGQAAATVMTEFKKALAAAADGTDENPEQKSATKRSRQLQGAQVSSGRSRQRATSNVDPNSDDAEAHWNEFERMDAKQASRGDAW